MPSDLSIEAVVFDFGGVIITPITGHDRIAYLDDFEQNLAPAVALGWTTIHVKNPLDAITALDRLLTA